MPDARWGHAEVVQWLAGERPQVVKARRHAPIRFADVSHDDPPSLAFDLLDRSDKGEVWLRTHSRILRTWLDREVRDFTFDRGHLTQLEEHPERAHLAISALAARFVPGMPPRYRGHEVSAEGVLALATGEGSRHAALREAVELGALGFAARHWCDHPGCRAEGTNRCALLERVQHEVPLVMRQVETTVDRLARTDAQGPDRPGAHEWDAAWARAVELVLDPEAPARHRRLLRAQSWHPAQRSDAPRTPWWREQRGIGLRGRRGEVTANAALVTAVLLLPSAARAGALQRDRDREDSRARRRGLWERTVNAAGAGWAGLRERLSGPRGAPPHDPAGPPPYSADGRPLTASEHRRAERRRAAEAERVNRGMRQIQRAMGAGRCRRFAYPAGLLGVLDGVGLWLWESRGLSGDTPALTSALDALTAFAGSAPISALSGLARGAMALIPGGVGLVWWFSVALGLALWLLGRTAANRRRKARTQLMAYRLAVAGSIVMAVRLLAGGLFYLGTGVLIPVSMITG